jgi:hypothetical protein
MVTSLRMYDNAIRCARKLNPAWREGRKERLELGHFQNRPYTSPVDRCGAALSISTISPDRLFRGRTQRA